jgi:branched-chain amino acid transport system substrate-binding protein
MVSSMRVGRWLTLALACAALGAAGCGGSGSGGEAASSKGQTLKIGLSVPLSGPDAGLAVPLIDGAKLAAKQANAPGGAPGGVKLDIQDDQEKPEIGTAVARKFCGDQSISAVVGHFASIVSLGAAPIYSRCGPMAMVAPTSSNDLLSQKGYVSFFRICGRNSQQAERSAIWVAKNLPDVKRVATIDANDATTRPLAQKFGDVFAQQGGGRTVIDREQITAGGSDFRGVLTKILAKRPDLIYMGLFVQDGALVIKQARQLGYRGPMLGMDAMATPDVAKLAGTNAAEGVYISNLGLDPGKLSGPASDFVAAYKSAYGSTPPAYAADGYDAVRVILAAWKRAGTTDRAKLRDAIAKTSMQGVQGHLAFTPAGDQQDPAIGIYQFKSGQLAFVGKAG